ncbi:hypothetical protein ABC977_15500 [Thioalkalicoccus limnaeus]|uniref:ESX secretion-associated protein EspG n=1 Tax=Thioalkalicoccus limnaeus TaxID=120681 RepID=A0ABV4BMW0_9GAMM
MSSRSELSIEFVAPAAARIQWEVGALAWARLDAEFPGGVGATRALLRLRRVQCNGTVQPIAAIDLGERAAAHRGQSLIPLAGSGDYEAELGLASADGGWLVLCRSTRRAFQIGGDESVPAARQAREPGMRPESVSEPVVPSQWGWLLEEIAGAGIAGAPSRARDSTSGAPGRGPAAAGYRAVSRRSDGVETQAELLVFGSGPPGAVVDLYGRPFRVGPGGAFALRFAIPDEELLDRILAGATEVAPRRPDDGPE